MKKISSSWMLLLVIGLSLVLVSIISAQQPGGERARGDRTRPDGPQDRQFDPEAMMKRMIDRTMEQLKLPEEEATVIRPMVEKIMRTRTEQSQKTRELMNSLREAVNAKNNEKIKSTIAEIKAKREKDRAQLDGMEKELTELLTIDQEAALTLSGVVNSDGMGMGFFGGGPGGPGGPGTGGQRNPRQGDQQPRGTDR
ncbi:hypothetical protein FJZ33_07810 [Candidatus Poribacteria bacterium]|nr:hypothetical protein [Candidatus Poribacteria bacterium]